MDADQINTLALLIAKQLAHTCTKKELGEICSLLSQIMCNIGVFLKHGS